VKILKIEQENFPDGDKIVVHVEGYDHAYPVFDADITEKDLKTALAEWKVNQDAVDAINAQAKVATPVVATDISKLKSLEGKEI
jgi:hypothetical protein